MFKEKVINSTIVINNELLLDVFMVMNYNA